MAPADRTRFPKRWTIFRGQPAGPVDLPAAVAWTGRRTYHLEMAADLVVMYEWVIVEAPTVEVLNSLIDQKRLLSVWARLYLPQHVRRLWQARFPPARILCVIRGPSAIG
jgi:hypothetical protein